MPTDAERLDAIRPGKKFSDEMNDAARKLRAIKVCDYGTVDESFFHAVGDWLSSAAVMGNWSGHALKVARIAARSLEFSDG